MDALVPLSVAIPLLAAFLAALLGRRSERVPAWFGLAGTAAAFAASALGLYLVVQSGPRVYAVGAWPPPYGISMVLDGLSAFMLLTVNLVALVTVLYAMDYIRRYSGAWQFYTLFLLMLAGMNGVTVSGDLFNLFVNLELAAVASYALVAFGTEKHELEAAFKYSVMGSVGSLFLLLAIIWLYSATSTLNLADMAGRLAELGESDLGLVIAALFLVGFGLKAALVPFHAWLPDAHPSAPAPISAMLSGVLIKALGIYALCRILFGVLGFTPRLSAVLVTLGVVSMLVGVILAVGQWDLKRLLAYHSISQVGYIILGVGLGTPLGLAAGLFHLFNHSIFKSLLFLDSGALEYATGTRDLRRMGGLGARMPTTRSTTLIASLSISGIPPFSGFWSKLLVILAAVEAGWYWAAFWAVLASLLTLASFTKVMKYAFFGILPDRYREVREAPPWMRAALILLAICCVGGGLLLLPEVRGVTLDPAAKVLSAGTDSARELLARYRP